MKQLMNLQRTIILQNFTTIDIAVQGKSWKTSLVCSKIDGEFTLKLLLIIKDVVLTMLFLHTMLIRNSDSLNVYRRTSLVDHVGYNRDTFYQLQTPRSGQNAKTSGEAI